MSSDAEREAERINEWADEQFSRGVEGAQGVDVDSFVAGAEWERSRPVSDAEVEVVARRMFRDQHGRIIWGFVSDAVKEGFRVRARAALEAAAEVRAQGGTE